MFYYISGHHTLVCSLFGYWSFKGVSLQPTLLTHGGLPARRLSLLSLRSRYGADDKSQKLKYHIQVSGYLFYY